MVSERGGIVRTARRTEFASSLAEICVSMREINV